MTTSGEYVPATEREAKRHERIRQALYPYLGDDLLDRVTGEVEAALGVRSLSPRPYEALARTLFVLGGVTRDEAAEKATTILDLMLDAEFESAEVFVEMAGDWLTEEGT
jgi:hypothetical protein